MRPLHRHQCSGLGSYSAVQAMASYHSNARCASSSLRLRLSLTILNLIHIARHIPIPLAIQAPRKQYCASSQASTLLGAALSCREESLHSCWSRRRQGAEAPGRIFCMRVGGAITHGSAWVGLSLCASSRTQRAVTAPPGPCFH